MKRIRNFFFGISSVFLGKELARADLYTLFQGIRKSVLVQMVSYVLVFISSILFVRIAGIEDYGIYVNIFNWLGVLAVIACAGMEDIVLAEIPVLLKKKSQGAVGRLIVFANKIVLIASFSCAIVFGLLIWWGRIEGFRENRFLFGASLVNIYFLAFLVVNQQALQAGNRFYASQVIDKVLKPFLLIVALTTCWLTNTKADASFLVFSNTIILLICAIAVFFLLKATFTGLKENDTGKISSKKLLTKSGYFLLISLLFLLKSRIGMLVIGIFGDTAVVGILNITYRLADFVLLPYLLIHSVVPQLFSGHLDSDPAYKKKLFRKSAYLLTIGSLFIYVLLILFGKMILSVYDARLVAYYHILLILGAAQFLYSLFGPSVSFLMMQGGQKQAAIALLIDITVNCVVLFFLFRRSGIDGAAWAALVGSLFYNIVLRLLVERRLAGTNK